MGRTGIFELLVLDNELRQLISAKADAHKLKSHAMAQGMKPLMRDGVEKVRAGLTTLEEVLRVTHKDHADISL